VKALKKVFELLYKDKQPKERPKKLEVKMRSISTPEERESFNKWCREFNVSVLYDKDKQFG